MSENPEHSSENASAGQPAPCPDGLWSQLGNAVALAAKQDQIVWTIFGVFWAADAVLLVALFTTGDVPKRPVGLVVSIVGVAISGVWTAIQHRAIEWLKFYETVMKELEGKKYLHVPPSIAVTGRREQVKGVRVRGLMLACPLVSVVLWGWALYWFFTHL